MDLNPTDVRIELTGSLTIPASRVNEAGPAIAAITGGDLGTVQAAAHLALEQLLDATGAAEGTVTCHVALSGGITGTKAPEATPEPA